MFINLSIHMPIIYDISMQPFYLSTYNTIDMINIDFWSIKIAEKKDLEIYIFFTLESYCDRGQFSSTTLVIYSFYVKYCSVLTQN